MIGAVAVVVLRSYSGRVMGDRPPSTPIGAAREYALGDNTVVGVMGAVREVALVELEPLSAGGDTVALSAEVVGRAGGGMLYADVARVAGEWRVLRAVFLTPRGERLPLTEEPPTLAR